MAGEINQTDHELDGSARVEHDRVQITAAASAAKNDVIAMQLNVTVMRFSDRQHDGGGGGVVSGGSGKAPLGYGDPSSRREGRSSGGSGNHQWHG